MIKNIKIILFAVYTVLIIAVTGYICYKIFHRDIPEPHITQDPIQYNVINNDINKLTIEQLRTELNCYYKSEPKLGIEYTKGDTYLLSAGLCERTWSRSVHINKPHRQHMIKARGSLLLSSSGWQFGAGTEYIYFPTEWFGLGGGAVLYTGKYFSLDISVCFLM